MALMAGSSKAAAMPRRLIAIFAVCGGLMKLRSWTTNRLLPHRPAEKDVPFKYHKASATPRSVERYINPHRRSTTLRTGVPSRIAFRPGSLSQRMKKSKTDETQSHCEVVE